MAWRRQWCHLCELPKPPWAVVGDFSQAVCRACANLEGAGRVELLLATARRLRGHRGATGALSPGVTALGLPPGVTKELREALCTEHHLRGHQGATGALSPAVTKELREALCTEHGHHGATSLALSPGVTKELREALCTEHGHQGATGALSPAVTGLGLSPGVPKELREALCTEHGHHGATSLALSPSVTKELREALCTEHHLQGHQGATGALSPRVTALGLSPSVTSLALSLSVPNELREALYTEHHLQGHHGATGLGLSPSVPKELREALCTEHGQRGATSLALSPGVPKELREALYTEHHLQGHHEATLSPNVPTELSQALCGRVTSERRLRRRHHRDVTVPLAVSPSVPTGLSRHHGTRAVSPSVPMELSGALCGRVTLEETERRHHATTPIVPAALQRHHGSRAVSPSVPTGLSRHQQSTRAVSPSVPAALQRHHGSRAVSPGVPAALQRHHGSRAVSPSVPMELSRHHATPAVSPAVSPAVPAALSAALAAAWPGKPRAVRERLSVLAGCAPFAVRFRKDHALVGRVLAFDAAPRAGPGGHGGDFELRLFAEYPCGSGSVYGALGLARRMFQDCVRASGRSISSGYKYLEYEKRQGSGEWRLLAELFTEPVRLFRRPPSPEALPQQQQQRCQLSVSPLSPPPRRRRKAAAAGSALSCGRCRRLLEDTHFVQCPAVPRHRFCFPCARRAIRARGPGAVHCPSGGRCPLGAAGPPWAFMQAEIAAILAGDARVKRERDP